MTHVEYLISKYNKEVDKACTESFKSLQDVLVEIGKTKKIGFVVWIITRLYIKRVTKDKIIFTFLFI